MNRSVCADRQQNLTLFPYACVFTALSMLTMTQVRHGDSRPGEKKHEPEHFDVQD